MNFPFLLLNETYFTVDFFLFTVELTGGTDELAGSTGEFRDPVGEFTGCTFELLVNRQKKASGQVKQYLVECSFYL